MDGPLSGSTRWRSIPRMGHTSNICFWPTSARSSRRMKHRCPIEGMPAIGRIGSNEEAACVGRRPGYRRSRNASTECGAASADAGLRPLRATNRVTRAGELEPGIAVAVWLNRCVVGHLKRTRVPMPRSLRSVSESGIHSELLGRHADPAECSSGTAARFRQASTSLQLKWWSSLEGSCEHVPAFDCIGPMTRCIAAPRRVQFLALVM